MRRRFKDYGFATLVLAALVCAVWIAANVAVPTPVPDFALRAEEIYRLEVGAAFFIAFYLVAMAFVLALSGRGFAELGTQGLKAADVVDRQALDRQQRSLLRQRKVDHQTQERLEQARALIDSLQAELRAHAERLEQLEGKR